MSAVADDELPKGHHTVQTASTGELVDVFVAATTSSDGYDFDNSFALWNVTWSLKGAIDLSTLKLKSMFFVTIPNLGAFALANAIGNLQTGVEVPFDVSTVSGKARFYLQGGWLHINLIATIASLPRGPAILKLFAIPL